MTKFYLARDKDESLWLFTGEKPPIKGESPFTDDKRYIAFSPSLEPPISLEKDYPAGKNVSFEGGPVEVIFSTMAEFEMIKSILFSQKMRIAAMRCCQNCRKNYEDEKCKPDKCANFEKWEPIP